MESRGLNRKKTNWVSAMNEIVRVKILDVKFRRSGSSGRHLRRFRSCPLRRFVPSPFSRQCPPWFTSTRHGCKEKEACL